jgi:hypothetical protein
MEKQPRCLYCTKNGREGNEPDSTPEHFVCCVCGNGCCDPCYHGADQGSDEHLQTDHMDEEAVEEIGQEAYDKLESGYLCYACYEEMALKHNSSKQG